MNKKTLQIVYIKSEKFQRLPITHRVQQIYTICLLVVKIDIIDTFKFKTQEKFTIISLSFFFFFLTII